MCNRRINRRGQKVSTNEREGGVCLESSFLPACTKPYLIRYKTPQASKKKTPSRAVSWPRQQRRQRALHTNPRGFWDNGTRITASPSAFRRIAAAPATLAAAHTLQVNSLGFCNGLPTAPLPHTHRAPGTQKHKPNHPKSPIAPEHPYSPVFRAPTCASLPLSCPLCLFIASQDFDEYPRVPCGS